MDGCAGIIISQHAVYTGVHITEDAVMLDKTFHIYHTSQYVVELDKTFT